MAEVVKQIVGVASSEDFELGDATAQVTVTQELGVDLRFETLGFDDPDMRVWTIVAPEDNPATLFGVEWHDEDGASAEDSRYYAYIDLQNGVGMCVYMTEQAFVGLYRECHEHYQALAKHRKDKAQKGRVSADNQSVGSPRSQEDQEARQEQSSGRFSTA